MSFLNLYESSKHRNNIAHFSAIVTIASVDGIINDKEQKLIDRFVKKLDITEEEYNEIIKNPNKFPIIPHNIADDRLERMLDFFKTIYSDHEIDESEMKLVFKYAIQLGYQENIAKSIVEKSIKLFNNSLDFDEYKSILKLL